MSAIREMLENEHAQCHGETIPHVCGMRSRVAREAAARIELAALERDRARLLELQAQIADFAAR